MLYSCTSMATVGVKGLNFLTFLHTRVGRFEASTAPCCQPRSRTWLIRRTLIPAVYVPVIRGAALVAVR